MSKKKKKILRLHCCHCDEECLLSETKYNREDDAYECKCGSNYFAIEIIVKNSKSKI